MREVLCSVLRRHLNQDFNRDTTDQLSRNQLFASPDDQKWDGAAKIIHRRFGWQLWQGGRQFRGTLLERAKLFGEWSAPTHVKDVFRIKDLR